MISGEAIEVIRDLAQEARTPKTITIDGFHYAATANGLAQVPNPARPLPNALVVQSLSALILYARKAERPLFAVHVESPVEVSLIGGLQLQTEQRAVYVVASFEPPRFALERFVPLEEFLIGVQTMCAATPDRAKLLTVLGNVRAEQVRTQADDGVTQTVTARQGVAVVAEVPVPNPVVLAPYRTFLEVVQPASQFVVRLRSGDHGIQVGLFPADGGAWRLEAIGLVAEYLRANLPEVTVLA